MYVPGYTWHQEEPCCPQTFDLLFGLDYLLFGRQEEKDRDASLRATWKREGVNVNVLQARNDIFDKGESGDDDDTPLWHQKYSEGVWAKDRCEDGDEQLTLEEVIEERNALPVSISERRKTPTVSMKDHMSLATRWSLLPQ